MEINMQDKKSFSDKDFIFWDKIFQKIILLYIPSYIKPNHITVVRFIIIPIMAFFLFNGQYITALILFIVGMITDALDGAMARINKQITNWGAKYDPLADKLLIVAFLILIYKELGYLIVILILSPEVLMMLIFTPLLFIRKEKVEIKANIWGKWKTGIQMLAVALLLVAVIWHIIFLREIAAGLFYLSVFLAFIAIIFQIRKYFTSSH
jgi:cardiolipin synthase